MSYPFLTPRYFAEEVEDAWHVFAERPHRESHRHVQGPLHEHLAKRIASDLNANQEVREAALRAEYWSHVAKC